MAPRASPTLGSYAPLRRVLSADVTCFVSLQQALHRRPRPAPLRPAAPRASAPPPRAPPPSPRVRRGPFGTPTDSALPSPPQELPSQSLASASGWAGVASPRGPAGNQTRLVRYAAYADARQRRLARPQLTYLHCPIVAGGAPRLNDEPPTAAGSADSAGSGDDDRGLLRLLDAMLQHYEGGGGGLYLHGGVDAADGRAVLVGACLLSLLAPTLQHTAVLEQAERAYRGAATPLRLSTRQRDFVRSFVSAVRSWERSDVAGGGVFQ